MADRPPAPDQPARDRITGDLASTLFVEAGAGSGKTTALVDRVVALVTGGVAELGSIAAITFTEKAAAELRDRIRRALEERADAGRGSEVERRCKAALDQLDGAAIGTLHAFAARILSEHPVEAGLPPRIEVLDEVSSGVAFERRWSGFLDELLTDPDCERPILLLLAAGVRIDALRVVAEEFGRNWDLVEERLTGTPPAVPPVRALLAEPLRLLEAVVDRRGECKNPGNRLVERLDAIAGWLARLSAIDDEVELLAHAAGANRPRPKLAGNGCGAKGDWVDVESVRAQLDEAGRRVEEALNRVKTAVAHRLGAAIARFTLQAARERQVAGTLEFHDLLVLARRVLRDPVHGADVRERLHHRYQRLLLDEFQDTDPIQIELAVRIAAAEPRHPDAGSRPWQEVAVAPGHLFVVGDPKQSIYRFRRADVTTFLQAQAVFGRAGGEVGLTANFRSVRPVIDWVNHVFARLFAEPPDIAVDSQPPYRALEPAREPVGGPAVSVVGRSVHPQKLLADELRVAEAADVVAAVRRALAEGWEVADPGADGGVRPARLGDIAILVPARTSLPFLEDALTEHGIPYRAESSSLVYATRAVRDLLLVLRAVDDPTDALRTVAALRTPLLGCGDDDLFRYRVERGGSWSFLARVPDTVPDDDPVRAALAYLRDLHGERHWRSPSELLDRVVRDRRALELGFAEGRPRDVWRRVRFVVDQARAWCEATGGGLRAYLQWVDQQTAEGARVAEVVLPETDDDAVRIMTIHAAKGLEFPIAIVSGMSTVPRGRRAAAEVSFPPDGTVGYRFANQVVTPEFERWKPVDEQMAFDERIRLLYVACTRARDHLVVSLHRNVEPATRSGRAARTNAELLVDGMGALVDELPDVGLGGGVVELGALPPPSRPAPPPPFDEWARERDAALRAAGRPSAVAATALTDEGGHDSDPDVVEGLQKRPRDLDLPPWLKGRYGSAVGRAVHGVLQTIDLGRPDDGAGIAAAVAAQCEAEAVPDRAELVEALVRRALGAAVVAEAAASPHWRELYVCTPLGERLLEGYVDLLYRGGDGLVVVDYKTAATDDPAELDRRVAGYRLQGAAYAYALGAATGEPVARVVFVFLTPSGAVERDLPDLAGAVREVEARVRAGDEVLVE